MVLYFIVFLYYIPSHIYTRSALITRMIIATSLIFLLRIMLESTHKWKKNHDRKGRRIISDHDRKGKRIISDPIDISANTPPQAGSRRLIDPSLESSN